MKFSWWFPWSLSLLALGVVLGFALDALAASSTLSGGVLLADGWRVYWQNFQAYWTRDFIRQGGLPLMVLALGALAIFIITRGKWQK